ncbi:MAG TPA: hypothetical protein RMI62_20850, partial [Polyangiaceae bacterium LLY-WYZ-15_(1-7)]|nr:hypothetical protein [Polyangiaceae bacterium LLY-WYZ-15_(1-7)]
MQTGLGGRTMFALPLRAAVLLGLWALCDAQSGSLCVAGTTESISNIKMDFSESSMIYNNLGGQGGEWDNNGASSSFPNEVTTKLNEHKEEE